MTQTEWRGRKPLPKRYRSLSNFYSGDRRRIPSRELDVGLWWREHTGGPLHRAAWVKDTGELYLVRLGPPEQGGGDVEVLAKVADRALLEIALAGWREKCGRPRSLQWLRLRALRLADRVEARPGEQTRAANLRPSAPARGRLGPPRPRTRVAGPLPRQTSRQSPSGRSFESREVAWRAVS